jgi:hypothetical protein
VQADVLLQYQRIGELLVAHRALMQHAHGWLGTVDAHVRLEVTFGGEGPATDLALEGPLSSVGAVVHLQGTLARQHPMADDALVWVRQFMFDVVYQLLQLGRFRRFRYFYQTLPGVVVAARPRE